MQARGVNTASEADFADFAARVQQPESAARLIAEAGLDPNHARIYVAAIINEAQLALRLLTWAGLRPGQRVLEVGAGAGLLTGYLQSRGVDLIAIEPIGQGFEATSVLRKVVQDATGVTPRISPIAARDLEPGRDGFFDVVFSINVIEHFQPLHENLDGLARVMGPGGVQVHTCPNYRIPYEPHYGIPLLPVAPKLTSYLWARSLRDDPLWRSLNFVTTRDVSAFARRHGMRVTFKQGSIASALQRLLDEPAFAARHPRLLRNVAGLAGRLGLIAALRHLPAGLATPMTIMLRRA